MLDNNQDPYKLWGMSKKHFEYAAMRIRTNRQMMHWSVAAYGQNETTGDPSYYAVKSSSDTICSEIADEDTARLLAQAPRLQQRVVELLNLLESIENYPVHSEPVGAAMAMQEIAHKARSCDGSSARLSPCS